MQINLHTNPQAIWHDPIVSEIHEIRQQLSDKYHGDLHAYSQAATANALALGFKFYTPPKSQQLD